MKNPSLSRIFNMAIENLVFIIAAIVLFFKTSELLAIFAPKTILGYENLGGIYGMVCALLVEGLLAVTKWSLDRSDNSMAWAYKVMLIVVTFLISGSAQVIDGFMIRDTLSQQPQAIQMLIQWGVPLVPSLILALAAGKAVFENIPPSVLADMAQKAAFVREQPKRLYASTTQTAVLQKEEDTQMAFRRRNELTSDDKDFIAGATVRQVVGKFGGSARRAREWKEEARNGKL